MTDNMIPLVMEITLANDEGFDPHEWEFIPGETVGFVVIANGEFDKENKLIGIFSRVLVSDVGPALLAHLANLLKTEVERVMQENGNSTRRV